MGILEKIKAIEDEMARTQKNKATEYHIGRLKARLAKLKSELLTPSGGKGEGEGFDVSSFGDGRIALIGFPSVGKSSLLSALTGTKSEVAAYEFTTLTCIASVIHYNDAKLQLLDLPGIIEGASKGRGRGRQVIAVARSSDLILMVLDATKDHSQKRKLDAELEACGIRLNKRPPNVKITRKKLGGIKFTSQVPLTKMDGKMVQSILNEYKIFNAEVVIREDISMDDFIDVIEGNRKYMRCLYVYNKIDMLSMVEIKDLVVSRPQCVPISVNAELNLDGLLERIWCSMSVVRVYTKKKGTFPDFSDPLILTEQRGPVTVESAVCRLHRGIMDEFSRAIVWGRSVKHSPQVVGKDHVLDDEDVMQIVKKQSTKK
jgi:small GTP-binding protein